MNRFNLRADSMTLDGQFTIARLPMAGKYPFKCAWVVDPDDNNPWGLYWSDGIDWMPMSGSGPPGAAATIAVGSVSALPPGSTPTVVNAGTSSAAVFNFGLPSGAAGAAATISVGSVTTLAPGSSATVLNTGTSSAAILAFGIPAGAAGAAATIAVGTVTTLAPGASATVTNAGTPAAAVFNFGIPAGAGGAAGVNAFGTPTPRTLALATAYQATTTTKPAMVTINLTSTANFSLLGGTTNSADIVIGPTNAVASGTGTVIGKYTNSSTGAIAVGLNMNTTAANAYTISLPTGWFFAVRQTSGTVSITSAFDQAVG